MKIVFDSNVIIDAVACREPFNKEAEEILLLSSQEIIKGYLTSNSITDIFYVIRRNLSESQAKDIIRSIMYSLDVIEVNGSDCWEALNMTISDFEDALIVTCAEKIKVDYIISRDISLTKIDSTTPIILPSEFLKKIK